MSSELSDNGKKTSKQQTICIISDEVIDCNLENRSDVAEIPQKSNMQKTNALPENSGNVFPVQQTVTYVPLNKLSSSNHIRQLRTYWIEPLVIIDIINKLNEKYSKHGVRLFDFLREHIDNEITMRFDDCRFAKPDNQPVLNSKQILDELNRIHGKQIYNLDECVLYDGGEFEIMSNLKTPEKQLNCIKCKSRNGCDCSPDGELASIKYIPTRCSSTSNDSNNEKNIPNRAKTPYHPVTKKSVLSPSENKIVKKSESPHKSSLKRKGKRKSSRRRSRFTSSSSDITTSSSSSRSSSSSPHRSRRSRHRSRKRSRYSRGRHESKRRRSESHRSRTSTRHRSRSTDNKSKKDDLMPKTNTDFFYRLSDKSFKYAADSENFLQNSFLTATK